MKANLAVDLEKLADGPIIKVALGKHYDDEVAPDGEPIGRPLTWAIARPYLDDDYDSGYGGAHCRPFIAWTMRSIYVVNEYEGSTRIMRVPRHPEETMVGFY